MTQAAPVADVIEEFAWRGFLHDATEGARAHLSAEPRVCYIGFDPSAASLHVGSLATIMGLVHLQRAGHHPIALVGGGTGLIGDPSGKTAERSLLSVEEAAANAEGIHRQLERFLDFDTPVNPARMVNNLDWLGSARLVEFLRDTGKFFSVNAMLKKESVRRRLEAEESGISYTEFSYLLLQAYDFYELHRREGCTVQLGGSDQWGNITAGIDLLRRRLAVDAYGVTFPLITSAAGSKFGKTEAGAVWLDADLTSPYRFYQFWINTDDADVGARLRTFTLLPRERIEELEAATEEAPHRREAQRALADDVTERVHGAAGLDGARRATQALFGGGLEGLSAADIEDVFADVPSTDVDRDAFSEEGKPLVELLADTGVCSSRGDARRSIDGGGIYVNNERVGDVETTLGTDDAIEGRFVVLRKGKKSYHLVRLV